jgi:hypothetical protein
VAGCCTGHRLGNVRDGVGGTVLAHRESSVLTAQTTHDDVCRASPTHRRLDIHRVASFYGSRNPYPFAVSFNKFIEHWCTQILSRYSRGILSIPPSFPQLFGAHHR